MIEHDGRYLQLRLLLFGMGVVVAIAYLIYRLWDVQMIRNEEWTQRLQSQTTVMTRLSPARGAIVDRFGVALAENRASFDIDFYLDELVRYYSREHGGRLPRIKVETKRKDRVITRTEPDIVKIVNDSMDPIAKSLGLQQRPDPKDLRTHYRIRHNIPFQYRTDVDFATLAQFSERNLGVPGIEINPRPVRQYNFGAFAPHIIGYIGKPEDNEQAESEGMDKEFVGKEGIEKIRDANLQGKSGGRIMRVNYRGYIDREESATPPTVGSSVYLTLDARIQYLMEETMRGVGRGAAVMVDVNSGDVLGMVSVPNYDPNIFIPKISSKQWNDLHGDPTKPMINRVLNSYAPGSTYKVMIALAGLKSKAITASTIINSPGAVTIGNREFKDWNPGGQGPITVHDGLRMSCNTFFYQLGIRTKVDPLMSMAKLCGFGVPTEIPLSPESPGILPTPEWMKAHQKNVRWSEAHTANFSIGQGYVQVSPLQLALFMGAVANGGTLYYPRLIQRVESLDGEVQAEIPVRKRNDLEVSHADMNVVRQGLLAVVENGTAPRAKIPGIKVAGKTGTAQSWSIMGGRKVKDNKTWFFCFAPYESPKYALCIMVEGGTSGGGTCAPIAKSILEKVFAMETNPVKLGYLTPAIGHFHGVTEDSPAAQTSTTSAPAASAVPDGGAADQPNVVNEDDRLPPPPPIMPRRR